MQKTRREAGHLFCQPSREETRVATDATRQPLTFIRSYSWPKGRRTRALPTTASVIWVGGRIRSARS